MQGCGGVSVPNHSRLGNSHGRVCSSLQLLKNKGMSRSDHDQKSAPITWFQTDRDSGFTSRSGLGYWVQITGEQLGSP
uniref:Nuclear speckle splicing regulatory protein 1 n=1 Tax=Nothobranchius korthausae TaxID=1143690 RepID=A0A1A8HKG8_9TELE